MIEGHFGFEIFYSRIFRFILADYSSPYTTLFSKVNSASLCSKRVQNFLILLQEFVFHSFPCLYEEYVFTLDLFLWSSWQLHSHLVNLKQLPMVLNPCLTFQLSSGMHYLTLSAIVFLQNLRLKYRVFLYVDSFCLYILILKTVNNTFFCVFYHYFIIIHKVSARRYKLA